MNELLTKLFWGQVRSSEVWIDSYLRYQDVPGVRNAAMAIGKVHGIYSAMLAVNGMDADLPEDIIQKMTELNTIWCNLVVK